MCRVLFVCTGNTCRSPMAQFAFQHLASVTNIDVESTSAGIDAILGQPMSKQAKCALKYRNISFCDHTSAKVDDKLLAGVDLVLCMTKRHAILLNRYFPNISYKVKCLAQTDIDDPYGKDCTAYIQCLDDIAAALQYWIDIISTGEKL